MKKPKRKIENTDLQNREDRLYAEKVRTLHRQIPSGIFPAYLTALSYSWTVWNILPHWNILIWLFTQTAALAGRVYLYRSFKETDEKIVLHRWKTYFTLLTYLTATAWGSAAFFLFPDKVPALQIFLILLIGGLAAGTVGLYAVFLEIVVGFIVLSLSPFVFHYLVFQSDTTPRWMALFIAIYGAAMISTARRVKESVTRALELAEDLKVEIGERRRAEEALKVAHDELNLRVRERTAELSEANAALRKLTNAIEQTAEMLIITDLDGQIEYVNPAVEKISGFSAESLIGQPFRKLQKPEEASEADDDIFRFVQNGETWEGEIQNQKKSGESYPAHVTVSAIYNDQGTMTHLTAIMRDVSEQKKMERDLLQARKLSSLGMLVSGISHELNTPVATILGFSEEIAKEKSLSPDANRYANWIVKESKRCVAIVRNLLNFSRRKEAKRSTFDVNDAVTAVLPLYQYQLQSEFIHVETELLKKPLPVSGDPEQVQQVILNILQNAHQAIADRDGRGVIRVHTEELASEAHIHIENNGPEIPASDMERIFDPFFTTKGTGDGTGLGLSLSYGIIQAHGGRIAAENMEAGGVRFSIVLPIAEADETAPVKAEKRPVLPKDLKILIVEDDLRFSEWLRLFLGQEGASVVTAANGREAIRSLNDGAVDLILSDLKMPKMDGIALFRWLEEHAPEYVRRFVLLTGVGDSGFDDFCQARGVPVLLKPVDKVELIRTLCKVEEKTHV